MISTYTIAKILEWYKEGSLQLRPEFQRRPNWPPRAKVYFVDTILRDYPVPLIYLRARLDSKTKSPIRDVVDGQQRLTAIIQFSDGQFRLDESVAGYQGLRYDELELEDQNAFLSYNMGVEELVNASDEYVLEVFHRLNSNGVQLNAQELRHGKFRGIFRNTIVQTAERWTVLWNRYNVVTIKNRLRMKDDELTAEMLGIILRGVSDGGQLNITRLYTDYDKDLPREAVDRLDGTVQYILDNLSEVLATKLRGAPHFLMLFAAVAHAKYGIYTGDMGTANDIPSLPERNPDALTDLDVVRKNLDKLVVILKQGINQVPAGFFAFRHASAGTTQRIRSRSQRFVYALRGSLAQGAVMASTANVERAFGSFQTATQDIRQRFNAAIPPFSPYSTSCPPIHDEGKCLLVNVLQNQWAVFCRELLEHSIAGNGPTLGGTELQPIILPDEGQDHDGYLKSIANRIGKESFNNKGFPIWHQPDFVIRVAKELQPSNHDVLVLGMSASPILRRLNVLRNFIIHGPDRKVDYEKLLNEYGLRDVSPAEFLAHRTPSGTNLFEDWLEEIVQASRSAAT